jgi:hypothetical protein
VYNLVPTSKENVLPLGQCISDATFDATETINGFFREHLQTKNRMIIVASFFMDFMMLSSIVFFNLRIWSFRLPLAFGLFFVTRQVVQNVFLMGRPDTGFLWSHPGIPSLTVPYHDTNDFYYSGHVGSCTLYLMEFVAVGSQWMQGLCLFVLVVEWTVLMLLRTHYIIDLVSGAMIAHLALIQAEWLSFFLDVKLTGLGGKERQQMAFEVCPVCGWSNSKVSVGKEERLFLKRAVLLRRLRSARRRLEVGKQGKGKREGNPFCSAIRN